MKINKIKLVKNLGEIIVRDGYNHQNCLECFRENEGKNFIFIHEFLTDKKFSKPTDILKPGDKIHTFVYKLVDTSIREHLKSLHSSSEVIFPGPQGISLVWEQKGKELDKGDYYLFDKKKTFGKFDGGTRIPNLDIDEEEKPVFSLGFLDLSFFDLSSEKELFFFLFLKDNFNVSKLTALL